MMHNWFTCKIRYEKTMENGMQKKVTEPYLVDALSFTEAESRIIEEMNRLLAESLRWLELQKLISMNCSQVKKSLPTAGSNVNSGLLHWMKRAEQKSVLPATYLYKLPTFATPSRSWTKE